MAILGYDDLVRYRGAASAISETPGYWLLPPSNMADRRVGKVARTDQSLGYVHTEIVTLPADHDYSGGFIFSLFGLSRPGGTLSVQFALGTSIGSPSNLYTSAALPWAAADAMPDNLVHFCSTASEPRAMILEITSIGLTAPHTDIGRLWLSPYRDIRFSRGWKLDDDDSPEIFESQGGQVYARNRPVRQSVEAELMYIDTATKAWLRSMKRIAGKSVEVVSCPYGPTGALATADNWRAETIYGLANCGPFVHAGGARFSMSFSQKESR